MFSIGIGQGRGFEEEVDGGQTVIDPVYHDLAVHSSFVTVAGGGGGGYGKGGDGYSGGGG